MTETQPLRSHESTVDLSARDRSSHASKRTSSPRPALDDLPEKTQKMDKIIRVGDLAGKVERVPLGSQEEYTFFLDRKNCKCLVDQSQGTSIYFFQRLDEDVIYCLGGPRLDSSIAPRGAATQPNEDLVEFDYDSLPSPSAMRTIIPKCPRKPPEYLCPPLYRENIMEKICYQLPHVDDAVRVPPMALVGCTRSGKTATLEEIARHLATGSKTPVKIIFVSFNDYSPLLDSEKRNPLQALLLRLVFAVMWDKEDSELDAIEAAFKTFQRKNYVFDRARIENWLGNAHAVLLIDDLDNLLSTDTEEAISNANDLGDFLRFTSLTKRGRYLIFTCHALATLEYVTDIVDSSSQSSRRIDVQNLPLATDLSRVVKFLKHDLKGAREAIYYGLLPGMIFDQSSTQPAFGKVRTAANVFNTLSLAVKQSGFISICKSLSSGSIKDVPEQLHALLVMRSLEALDSKASPARVSWVPFILEIVLETMQLDADSWQDKARLKLSSLCHGLLSSKEGSGKARVATFALVYIARCVARCPFQDWLPEQWTRDPSVRVVINPFSAPFPRWCKDCTWWSEIKQGMDVDGPESTIAIFIADNASFASYDLVAAYFRDRAMIDCRAFQLKEGKYTQARSDDDDEISNRFLIKGDPPSGTFQDNAGWIVPIARQSTRSMASRATIGHLFNGKS